MKRSKRMITLVGILAVVCVATLALSHYEEKQEQISVSQATILAIPTDTVESLSWEYQSGGLAFHKDGDGWLYDEDEAFPVSTDKIERILSQFADLGAAFVIEDVDDYGQYGLDDPECVIHLGTDGEVRDIKLGDFSKMDQQRYVDIGDGNVYLVSSDPMDRLETALSGMIRHDDTPGFENVVDITFSGSESYTIEKVEDSTDTYNSDEDIYFTRHGGRTVPLDTAAVRTYLNTITALDLSDYVTYNVTDEELAGYGLDEPLLSVTVNYTHTDDDGQTQADTCIIHISEDPEERAAADAAEEAGETAGTVTRYVRVGESQIVYTLDSVDFAILKAASYDDLRHKEIFWADFDKVTGLDITLEGEQHSITSVAEEDEESGRVWSYGGEDVDISDLQTALEALRADSFTEGSSADKEELDLTLYLDDENFPQVRVRLYRYDGSLCLAEVDGETVCFVSRADVMALVEAVQAIVLN